MSFENYGGAAFPSNGQTEGAPAQVQVPQDGAPGANNVSAAPSMPFSPEGVQSPTQQAQPGPPGEQKTTLW
jgi:hypothetical protein